MSVEFAEVRGSFARAQYCEPSIELLEMMLAEHREDVAAFMRGAGRAGEPTIEDARALAMDIVGKDQVWISATYVVSLRPVPATDHHPAMVHLSIRRQDREVIRDWRELQRIKNELIGPEHEAVELFPAESRKIDTANQYHMWALASPDIGFPFGFRDGMTIGHSAGGAVQRPFEAAPLGLPIKVWVVTEGGYDWSSVVGVYLDPDQADKRHQELVGMGNASPGYGAGVEESRLT